MRLRSSSPPRFGISRDTSFTCLCANIGQSRDDPGMLHIRGPHAQAHLTTFLASLHAPSTDWQRHDSWMRSNVNSRVTWYQSYRPRGRSPADKALPGFDAGSPLLPAEMGTPQCIMPLIVHLNSAGVVTFEQPGTRATTHRCGTRHEGLHGAHFRHPPRPGPE